MHKKTYFISLFILSFIFSSCFQSSVTDTSNSTITEGLIVDYYSGGGKSPAYEKIYISKDSAYREIGNHIEREVKRWTPTEKDLVELCDFFEINKYKRITSTKSKDEVFDRGGVIIKISYKGNKKELNDSDDFFIDKKWKEAFQTIKNRIIAYASSNSN